MSKQLQSFIIDLEVRLLLLSLFEVIFLGNHWLIIMASLGHLGIIVVVLFGTIDDIIWIILTLDTEQIHLLVATCISIDSHLQTICISQILFDLLR